jgi:dienelactone hydrolase
VRKHSPAVFYLHDWGETATAALSRSTRLTRFLQSLAELGYLVLVADFGDPAARDHAGSSLPFDSSHVAQRMEAYRRWLATRPAAASNANVSTIGLLGSGRGAASCLAYARAHRSTVSVMAAVNPVTDADLEALAPVAGIPWRGYYRRDDPAVDPATLAGLKRHLGESAATYDVGTIGGHRTDVWGDLSFTAFTSWFSTYHPVPPH